MTTTTLRRSNASSQLDPRMYFAQLRATPEFRDEHSASIPDRLRVAAEALCVLETSDSGYRTLEGNRMALLATVEQFAIATERIVQLRRRSAPTDALRTWKERIIPFNHAVRSIVDAESQLKPDELIGFISSFYFNSHQNSWQAANMSQAEIMQKMWGFKQEVEGRLAGMCQEIWTEQMLYQLGYECDTDVTVAEEARGIDGYFSLHGGNWIPYDTKANKNHVDKARAYEHRHPVLWSSVSTAQATKTGFRLPPVLMQRHAPLLQREIDYELNRCRLTL